MARRSAFSLVELSIVLVIVGLITGGVLTGRSLIRASEVRAVATEYNNWIISVNAFKERYLAIPGDMTNATSFWGNADAGGTGGECSDPDNDAGTGTQTCNGDGDNLINLGSNEMFRFWQHLSVSGLIDATFTGVRGKASQAYSLYAGENTPASKIGDGKWAIRAVTSTNPSASQLFAGNYKKNYLILGHNNGLNNSWPSKAVLTPHETWSVDIKIDDGMPGRGKMVVRSSDGWNNAGGTLGRCTLAQDQNDKDAEYMFDNDELECAVVFLNVF